MKHLNWDNLRYVLMVANQGSLSAAARSLGVNRSTVLRRIERFQQDLNCRIFNRSIEGYSLTPEAEKMIDAARSVENTLYEMQRQVEGRELSLEGDITVTTTDTFMVGLLNEALAGFRLLHPHIVLNLNITNKVLDLSRHDADVAIRPADSADAKLLSYKLCEFDFKVYRAVGKSITMNNEWIGLSEAFDSTPLGRWFEQFINEDQISIRCDSLVAARSCAEAGMGLALLPTFLGASSAVLEPVDYPQCELSTKLWLLTHPELVRSARVSAFIDYLTDIF